MSSTTTASLLVRGEFGLCSGSQEHLDWMLDSCHCPCVPLAENGQHYDAPPLCCLAWGQS